jgi:hypothetical protein
MLGQQSTAQSRRTKLLSSLRLSLVRRDPKRDPIVAAPFVFYVQEQALTARQARGGVQLPGQLLQGTQLGQLIGIRQPHRILLQVGRHGSLELDESGRTHSRMQRLHDQKPTRHH